MTLILSFGLIDCATSGYTAWKIWKGYAEITLWIFMNDSNIVSHVGHLFEFNSGLALDAFKCANWYIFFRVRNCNTPLFRWMPELDV